MTENNALNTVTKSLQPPAEAEVSVSASRLCAEERKYDIRPGGRGIRAVSFFLRVTHRKERGGQVKLA